MLNPRNENKIEDKIIRRLVKVCSSEEKKRSLFDFKYFYSIINTHKSHAKKNFMADLIFAKNCEINIEKYKRKVEMLFKNLTEFLKSDEILLVKSKIIMKEHFLKKISNQENALDKFHYFSIVKGHPDWNIEILALQGIKSCCQCVANNIKDSNNLYSTNSKDVSKLYIY